MTSKLPVPDYTKSLTTDVRGLRAGLLMEFLEPGFTSEEVRKSIMDAVSQLEGMGVIVEEVSLPILKEIGPAGAVISGGDGAFLQRELVRRKTDNYTVSSRRSVITNSLIPTHVLDKANKMRALFRNEWVNAFKQYDVLLGPTRMTTAIKLEYDDGPLTREKAEKNFEWRRGYTCPASIAGTPAMSIPCGFDSEGLPIGIQIMASHFREDVVLAVGNAYENNNDWHMRRPLI